MITLALVATFFGAVAVLGMTGLLVSAVARPSVRPVWRSAVRVGLVGLAILAIALICLVSQAGPCSNTVTC